jgi:hypothetical protein
MALVITSRRVNARASRYTRLDILHRVPLPQSAVILNAYDPDISNVYDNIDLFA